MSVKKKPAGRRSANVEVEAPDNSQTATERRSAEAELRALITKFAPAHSGLIRTTRKNLRKRLPSAHEVIYEYQNLGAVVISISPSGHGYEGVFAIRATADGVRLYFNQGKGLPDPEKLLQGSGGVARWILLESASTLTRPEVARLIEEAIACNRVPFALEGSGSVVVRSTTAKKRSRKEK